MLSDTIHIWNLPLNRNCVVLEENFKEKMINFLLKKFKTKYRIQKELKVSRRTILKLEKTKYPKINLVIIDKLVKGTNNFNEIFSWENIEKNIVWIGASQGKGIRNPNLPFEFSNEFGARFLSAISGDGSITTGGGNKKKFNYGALFYTGEDNQLKNSVMNDAKEIFGLLNPKFHNNYILFPSICRDTVEILTTFKGEKSVNNPKIPDFIFSNKKLVSSWIEQIIADEGEIRWYPEQYERAVVWRRTVDATDIYNRFEKKYSAAKNKTISLEKIGKIRKSNFIEDERKMLDLLGISNITKPIGLYFTKDRKIKLRWEIRISGKSNLLKLRSLIKIPSKTKDRKFSYLILTYS